jgi:hypothetical protein
MTPIAATKIKKVGSKLPIASYFEPGNRPHVTRSGKNSPAPLPRAQLQGKIVFVSKPEGCQTGFREQTTPARNLDTIVQRKVANTPSGLVRGQLWSA